MFSLIVAGAESTNFLASNKLKPVTAWTALITATFVWPAFVNTTVTLTGPFGDSSSTGAAAPAATGAAAVTPNSSSIAFTKSFNYKIVISFKLAIISAFVNFAIFNFLL